MDAFLSRFWWLKSRKLWAFVGTVVTILTAAASQDPYPIDTVIQGIVAALLGYMGTVAWEDTARAKAEAPPVTTVTTPGASDVTVIAPPETPATAHPIIGRIR